MGWSQEKKAVPSPDSSCVAPPGGTAEVEAVLEALAELRGALVGAAGGPSRAAAPGPSRRCDLAAFSKHFKISIFAIFGGLVVGCLEADFCKKICVLQHFSSSTRFDKLCTILYRSKHNIPQQIGVKNLRIW